MYVEAIFRMEEDHCSQFIDMDLDRTSKSWDTGSASRLRNLQKSFGSEEFDFDKCRTYMKDAMYDEQVLDVAPADEIFFKGQLLPLQQDPRLHLVRSLVHTDADADVIDINVDNTARSSIDYYPKGHSHRNENADEKKMSLFVTSQCEHFMDLDCFTAKNMIHSKHKGKFILSCVNEERFILPMEGGEDEDDDDIEEHRISSKSGCNEDDFHQTLAFVTGQVGIPSVPARSSRSDGIFDGYRNDSRSSSFRSQQSSYWSCGDKDSRDSSSSSRCSNGSSQDSCFQNSDRKPPLPQILSMDTSRSKMKSPSPIFEVNGESNHHPSKAPIAGNSITKGKKWSWKSIFGGLRKASKMLILDDKPQAQHCTQGGDVNKHKKSVFPFKTPSFGQRKSASGDGESESHGISRYYISGTGMNYYDTNIGRESKDKAKTWSVAKESWQRCVNKVKRGKLFVHHKGHHMDEDIHHGYSVKAKSLSTTPLAKSPARRRENPNVHLDCGFSLNGTTTTSSTKYMNLGFASCPASMRSSPHHSGVLAVVNKPPPLSSVQDIHTAIQGAIAHCKQSHGAKP